MFKQILTYPALRLGLCLNNRSECLGGNERNSTHFYLSLLTIIKQLVYVTH